MTACSSPPNRPPREVIDLIAAASPTVVLGLLDRIAALEAGLRECIELADSALTALVDDHHHEHRSDVERLHALADGKS